MREDDGWAIFRAGSPLIARDYFEEHGLAMVVAPAFTRGYGSGSGYGSGDGSGYGYGDGDGDGSGYGSGDGDGYGSGYGSGDGSGYGDGKRPLSPEAIEMNECIPGRNYLLFVGDGFAYAGRFARPAGPFGAVLDPCVNLCRTGGVPWDELARGGRRSAATYRRFDGPGIFPMVVGAFEWAGELPQAN